MNNGGGSHAASSAGNVTSYGDWSNPQSFGSVGALQIFPFAYAPGGGRLRMLVKNLLMVHLYLVIINYLRFKLIYSH